jgi:hypothetical protein
MAQANPATWELVKQLWIQGTKASIISERCGVTKTAIEKRAYRLKWADLRTSTTQFMVTQSQPLLSESVAQASIASRKAIAERIRQAAALVPAPTSYRQAMQQQCDLEPMVRNAEKLFQWSQSSQSSLVNVSSLSKEHTLSVDAPAVQQIGPTMDVQALPESVTDPDNKP